MSLLFILSLALMLGVLAVLVLGVLNLARGGDESGARSNRLMRWRIGLQAGVIALLGALVLLAAR
jgi:hypothetical protein